MCFPWYNRTNSPFIWITNLFFSSRHFQNGNICFNCCRKISVTLNNSANKLTERNTPKILLLGREQNVFYMTGTKVCLQRARMLKICSEALGRDCSVGKVLTAQTWGPEFDAQHPAKNQMRCHLYTYVQANFHMWT